MATATKAGSNGVNRIAGAPVVESRHVTIKAPNRQVAQFKIRGNAWLVVNKFSEKARQQIEDTQKAGGTTKKNRKRDPKDFDLLYEASKHVSTEGWLGIPCASFRHALIDACRSPSIDFSMAAAKQAFNVLPDGESSDFTPLVKITKGKPEKMISPVRNDNNSCDLRARAKFNAGWEAVITIRFDADAFTLQDIANLLAHAGASCGVLEGRPSSKDSPGMGWGTWDVVL